MRSRFQVLALALLLSVMPVPHLSAQPPADLPPRVEIQEAFVVGSDLAVTLNWSTAIAPPPSGARLKLLDSQGLAVGSVSFTPLAGSQTVWISGGALPRTSSEPWPLERYIELLSEPSREILLEKEASVSNTPTVVTSTPRRPVPIKPGQQCYIFVDTLTCDDSEDTNGDEVYLDLGEAIWYGPEGVRGGTTMNLGWIFVLCDTCKDLNKTITFDLWDLDDPDFPVLDHHDFLGSGQESRCLPTPQETIKFSGSNYTYWLKYHVVCYEVTCP